MVKTDELIRNQRDLFSFYGILLLFIENHISSLILF